MGQFFSEWIHRQTTSRIAFSALVVFLLFTSLALPAQAARGIPAAAEVGSPDTSFFYTPEALYQMAEAYGEAGRSAYVQARFTFDIAWPLVYTLFLATAISWLFQRAFDLKSVWQRGNLVPVLGMLCDFLENGSTSLVMLRYPTTAPLAAGLAPFFTLVKWLLIYGSFGLLFIGGVVFVFGRLRARRPPRAE